MTDRMGPTARHRTHYLEGIRVDLVIEPGVRTVTPQARLVRTLVRALRASSAPNPARIGLTLTDDEEIDPTQRGSTWVTRDRPTCCRSRCYHPPHSHHMTARTPWSG